MQREQNGGLGERAWSWVTRVSDASNKAVIEKMPLYRPPFFTKSISQHLNEPLNVPQTRKQPKKVADKLTTDRLNIIPLLRMRAHGVIMEDRTDMHVDIHVTCKTGNVVGDVQQGQTGQCSDVV